MGDNAKSSPNAGLAVLLAGMGLGICLVLAAIVAILMIVPSLETKGSPTPTAMAVAPAQTLAQTQAHEPTPPQPVSPSFKPAPAELATMGAGDAVDRALGRPPARALLARLAGATLNKPQANPVVAPVATPAPGSALVPAGPPVRQVLPPPPGATEAAPVFAVEYAFFLDPDAALRFSAALAERGLSARLVEQRDQAGRNWTNVRSQPFADAAMALAFAAKLEQSFGLSATLVSEPAPPPKGAVLP